MVASNETLCRVIRGAMSSNQMSPQTLHDTKAKTLPLYYKACASSVLLKKLFSFQRLSYAWVWPVTSTCWRIETTCSPNRQFDLARFPCTSETPGDMHSLRKEYLVMADIGVQLRLQLHIWSSLSHFYSTTFSETFAIREHETMIESNGLQTLVEEWKERRNELMPQVAW